MNTLSFFFLVAFSFQAVAANVESYSNTEKCETQTDDLKDEVSLLQHKIEVAKGLTESQEVSSAHEKTLKLRPGKVAFPTPLKKLHVLVNEWSALEPDIRHLEGSTAAANAINANIDSIKKAVSNWATVLASEGEDDAAGEREMSEALIERQQEDTRTEVTLLSKMAHLSHQARVLMKELKALQSDVHDQDQDPDNSDNIRAVIAALDKLESPWEKLQTLVPKAPPSMMQRTSDMENTLGDKDPCWSEAAGQSCNHGNCQIVGTNKKDSGHSASEIVLQCKDGQWESRGDCTFSHRCFDCREDNCTAEGSYLCTDWYDPTLDWCKGSSFCVQYGMQTSPGCGE